MKLYRPCERCPNSQGWVEDVAEPGVCPDCEGSGLIDVDAVVVPWCAEHDEAMLRNLNWCHEATVARHHAKSCRLEDPARHIRLQCTTCDGLGYLIDHTYTDPSYKTVVESSPCPDCGEG